MTLIWSTALALAATPHADDSQAWQLPLGILLLGLLAGFLLLQRETEADASIDEEAREIDLGATRDEVVEALKQLEVEKPKMDPGQYEVERQQLLARGAKALQELDEDPETAGREEEMAPAKPGAKSAAPQGDAPMADGPLAIWNQLAPEWRGAISALTVVAVIGGFVYFADANSRTRGENDSITGGDIVSRNNAPPEGLEQAPPQIVAQIEALETQLKENTEDLSVLNQLTQLYLSASVPEQAMNYNTQVRTLDPKNKEGRAYLGVLRFMMGMGDKAIASFDEVLSEDPDHREANFYRGLILMELGRFEEAVGSLQKANELMPGNPNLARALEDAKRLADGKPPAAPTGEERIVSGTLDIDPAARATIQGSEVVFVSVKDPNQAGPPVAAIKMRAQFPAPFQITTADIRAMAGSTQVPDDLSLTVRVDLDGNAMTREKAPMVVVGGLKKGAEGVKAVLSMDGAPAPEAPAVAAGDTLVSGTATLAPGESAEGTLFISARPIAGGPPVAAKRVPGASFPYAFSLTKADVIPMMAGRPLPSEFIVKVHIDRDGNVSTQEDGPAAVLPTVKYGTTGVKVTLE